MIVENLPVPLDRRVWLEATTLREAGYRVTVIAPSDGQQPLRATIADVDVRRYPKPPEARGVVGYVIEFAHCWLWTACRSVQVWVHGRFDVIHACNPPDTFWLLAAVYRAFGVRFVFDHHDLSPEMFLAKGGRKGGLLYRALLWLERRTFLLSDVVIATNESHAAIARARGGVPAERIFIVRSGPDLGRLQVQEPDESLRGSDRRFLVGYLGEMCKQDGVDHLLRAAETVVRRYSRQNVRFILLGGGPELGHLRHMAKRMGLEEYVTFTGRVSDPELCRYLSSVDLCVDPDPVTEWSNKSTMNKIMEYMFFGKPIAAYPLTENMFSAGGAAFYAAPNDPADLARVILESLDDPAERAKRGRLGFERVREHLMWQQSVATLLAAYARVQEVS
jgi:glycosyltransferase involved in cell wall biosynthesis